jgi:hypothetical protein
MIVASECPAGCGQPTEVVGHPCATCEHEIMSEPPAPCPADCTCCAKHDPDYVGCEYHPEFKGCCPCCVDCRSIGPF